MKNGWIQTFTGRHFSPLNLAAWKTSTSAHIAHALRREMPLSNGHCSPFYSVAEHSVRVSWLLEQQGPREALWGLMHDAAEAYLPDLGGPIKKHFHLHDGPHTESFDTAEDRLLAIIATALKFEPIHYESIRQADLTLLITEARDLLGPPPEPWNISHPPLEERIDPWPPAAAEKAFLERFSELTL